MLYSKSTGGFYDAAIHGTNIPADAVEVSDQAYAALIAAQSTGMVITADADGNPIAVAPASLMTLSELQQAQIAQLEAAYESAVTLPVSFTTAGGVTKTFQADQDSQMVLVKSQHGFEIAGSVPQGFYWVAADNTQVPFTLADLKGLYGAMLAQGWAAFQHMQTLKATIRAATTRVAVTAVTW